MNSLDKKILAAIKSDSEENWQNYSQEKGLFGLIGESFKGKLGWVVILATILILIFLGLTVYCGYQMLHTDDVATKIDWFAGGLVCFIIFSLLRLWYFMELNRISIHREIKRLEMLVSLLVSPTEN